jgi:phosphatidylglycerophosphatase C
MNSSKQTIAAFDFDGTFITGDSMSAYLRLIYRRREIARGAFSLFPILAAYRSGQVSRTVAKERLLGYFLGGRSMVELEALGETLADQVLPRRIRPKALERLRWHQTEGHRCILITASLTFWTAPFARNYGLELIATQPEVIDGCFTGRLCGPNNYGPEKVNRLEQLVPSDQIGYLYAYGDTEGDRELLARANEGQYRPFHE